jgi:microsomal epoxide hydrolase
MVSVDPTAIRPFEIAVSDEVLADLQVRLSMTRFPDQLDGVGWDYGTDVAYLRELVDYWQNGFDWREQERQLNTLDHYKTTIDGLDIHFIHQRSPNPDALPLLVTHGWPGSVFEFTKIIGPLTDPEAHGGQASDAFHVVAPSLPGYGFSDKPRERGYGPEKMADINAKLMARLGYDRYGAQGGDWGGIISRWTAFNDAEHVAGLHLNFVTGVSPADPDNPNEGVPDAELARQRERQQFMSTERGYSSIQGTKPQTLGYGLNDSPAGLAAWIVEKFRTWCDCDGDIESIFTKDELLTNVMIYWTTGTITSSTRLYYESRNATPARPIGYIDVPTGAALFPNEINYPPRLWAENRYNIVQWTEMPRGGHFAALEQPELLVDDIRSFFQTVR